MNVLFIAPLPGPIGGQSLAARVLLDELAGSYEVTVVDQTKRSFKQGVSYFGRIAEVISILRKTRAHRSSSDVIYLTISESIAGNLKDLLLYLTCFEHLSRMVVHLHGGASMQRLLSARHPLLRRLNAFFLRRIGAVVVLGTRHAGMFAGKVAAGRLHVVPNFAQDELFLSPRAIEAKYRDIEPLRVLFLSNLVAGKGYSELLQAARVLGASPARVRFDFAGGFESAAQRREFLKQIENLESVTYHGIVRGNERAALFARAHVFCLPSYYAYEGQPISILEAYASGCAVMTTTHSGIADIFRPGSNGFEVEPRSPASIVNAIGQAIESPQRLRDIGFYNREYAERFRVNVHTRSLVRILDSVAVGAGALESA